MPAKAGIWFRLIYGLVESRSPLSRGFRLRRGASAAFQRQDFGAAFVASTQDTPLEQGPPAWMQALPMALIFLLFFIVPLILTVIVSFWNYNEYQIVPDFIVRNYVETFD